MSGPLGSYQIPVSVATLAELAAVPIGFPVGASVWVVATACYWTLRSVPALVVDANSVLSAAGFPLVWSRSVDAGIQNVLLLGDSNMQGSGLHFAGGMRPTLWKELRSWRGDLQLVGTKEDYASFTAQLGQWQNEGHPGFRIEQIQAALAGYLATIGLPVGIVVYCLGTNNILNSESLATLQTRTLSMFATLDANLPSARIVVSAVLPLVAGSLTGANQAAFDATRLAFNAWLRFTAVPARPNYVYDDTAQQIGPTEYQLVGATPDGVHLNAAGYGYWGQGLAAAVDRVAGPRQGLTAPRTYRQRYPEPWVHLVDATQDLVSFVANAGLNPGASNYAFAIDFQPDILDAAGAARVIAQYGTHGVAPFWTLARDGRQLILYWNNAAGTITSGATAGQPNTVSLLVGAFHRIAFIVNGTRAALYVNGQLVGVATGLPAWNFTQQNLTLGKATFNGAVGLYGNMKVFRGANVPDAGLLSGLLAAELDCWEGAELSQGGTSYYPLTEAAGGAGTTVADVVNGNPTGVLAGATAVTGNTTARPWDYLGA